MSLLFICYTMRSGERAYLDASGAWRTDPRRATHFHERILNLIDMEGLWTPRDPNGSWPRPYRVAVIKQPMTA